jgi:hypothetical protein
MSRRLLDLCLLAYPREHDRDYLRDLALDLAETQGMLPQAWSLLAGGLSERIAVRRRAPIVLAGFVLVALATGVIVSERGTGGTVSEVEHFVCQGGCGATERLVTARTRAGWHCTTHRGRTGERTTTWTCTRSA